MIPANPLKSFDPELKFVSSPKSFSLKSEIYEAYSATGSQGPKIRANIDFWTGQYQSFIDKVVQEVKTASQKNLVVLQVDLKKHNQWLPAPHLTAVARALYISYGIEIQEVDADSEPTVAVVTWGKDNPVFNASVEYLQQARKEGYLTDFTLTLNGKEFKAHKLMLGAKSPYFDRMFRAGFRESTSCTTHAFPDHMQEESVEMLLDYIYTGKIDLDPVSVSRLAQLVELAKFYGLDNLSQKCIQQLFVEMDENNVGELLKLAADHHIEDLTLLCSRFLKNHIPDNYDTVFDLATNFDLVRLRGACIQFKNDQNPLPKPSTET